MKDKLDNQGFSIWFNLLVIGLLLFIVIQIAKPYYHYYAFLWHIKSTMGIEAGSKEIIIKEKIMAYAKKKNIPLLAENLIVDREKITVKVKAHWTDVVDYFGYYQKKVTFVIDEEY